MERRVAYTLDNLIYRRELKDERARLMCDSRVPEEEGNRITIDDFGDTDIMPSIEMAIPQSFERARLSQLNARMEQLKRSAIQLFRDLQAFVHKKPDILRELRQRKEAVANDIRDLLEVEAGRKAITSINAATIQRKKADMRRYQVALEEQRNAMHRQKVARTAELKRQASEPRTKAPAKSKIVASSTEELKSQLQPLSLKSGTRQPTVRKDSTQTSPATPVSALARSYAAPIGIRHADQQQRQPQQQDGHATSTPYSPLPPPVPNNPSFGDLAAYPMKPESLGMGGASISRPSAAPTLPSQASSAASPTSQTQQSVNPTSSYSPLVPTSAQARTSYLSPQQYGQYAGAHRRMSNASKPEQQTRQIAPTVNNMIPQGSPTPKHISQILSPITPKSSPSHQRQAAIAAINTYPKSRHAYTRGHLRSPGMSSMISPPPVNAVAADSRSSQSVRRPCNATSSSSTTLHGLSAQGSPLRTPSNMVLTSHAPSISHGQQQWAQPQSQLSSTYMRAMPVQQYYAQMQHLQQQSAYAQELQTRLPQQQLAAMGSSLDHPQAQRFISQQMQGVVPPDYHVRSLSLDQRQGAPWLGTVNTVAPGFRGGIEMAGVPEEAVAGGSDEDGEYDLHLEQ